MNTRLIDAVIDEHVGGTQEQYVAEMRDLTKKLTASDKFNKLVRGHQTLVPITGADVAVKMAAVEGFMLGVKFSATAVQALGLLNSDEVVRQAELASEALQ